MSYKVHIALAAILVLAGCNKKEDAAAMESEAASASRKTRVDRPSRDVSSARDQLREALAAAKRMAPGEERIVALADLAWDALESAPEIATEAIRELPSGTGEKEELIEAYLRNLLNRDRSGEARAWADSLEDPEAIATAHAVIAMWMAEKNPAQAATMLTASDFTEEGVDPAAEQVLNKWMAENPNEAMKWASLLPAGESRAAGFKTGFAHWINSDPQSAFAWASSQNHPIVHHDVIDAMVGALSDIPDIIRNSVLESADPELRAEIEQGIANVVNQQSQEAEPEPAPEE